MRAAASPGICSPTFMMPVAFRREAEAYLTEAITSRHRDFVMSTYQELKKANPTFPILVREAESVKAALIARYGGSALE